MLCIYNTNEAHAGTLKQRPSRVARVVRAKVRAPEHFALHASASSVLSPVLAGVAVRGWIYTHGTAREEMESLCAQAWHNAWNAR